MITELPKHSRKTKTARTLEDELLNEGLAI